MLPYLISAPQLPVAEERYRSQRFRQGVLTNGLLSRYLYDMATTESTKALTASATALDADLRQLIVDDPLTALSMITQLRLEIAQRERAAVMRALEEHTWREVGEALGVSKQAAFQRFGTEWALTTKARLPKTAWKQTIKQKLTE
jgi:hypothetical protein